jgi:hypothetical protein
VIGRAREVAIAIATRMAYFRVCLTTGSEGEPARITLGGCCRVRGLTSCWRWYRESRWTPECVNNLRLHVA